MKISTNSNLAKNKPNWIDFNAGALVEGVEMKDLVSKFIDKIIAVASGEEARNEYNGYRENLRLQEWSNSLIKKEKEV